MVKVAMSLAKAKRELREELEGFLVDLSRSLNQHEAVLERSWKEDILCWWNTAL